MFHRLCLEKFWFIDCQLYGIHWFSCIFESFYDGFIYAGEVSSFEVCVGDDAGCLVLQWRM